MATKPKNVGILSRAQLLSNAKRSYSKTKKARIGFIGAVGTVSGAATLPPGTPGAFQLDIRIFCEKGLLHIDIARDHLSLHTHAGKHQTVSLKPGDGAYRCDESPHEFAELILGLTKQNHSPGEIALRSVEMLDAAYRSSRSGREESV